VKTGAAILITLGVLLLGGSVVGLAYSVIGLVTHSGDWRMTLLNSAIALAAGLFLSMGSSMLGTASRGRRTSKPRRSGR